MRHVSFVQALACVATLGVAAPAFAAGPAPTYNKDIAPILNSKCVTCHRTGEIAPMALTSYKDVRPWVRSIKQKVSNREMPPWFADAKHSLPIDRDSSLTPDQISTIVAWVDAGAPQGTGEAPPAPKFVNGWHWDREPDAIIEMPMEWSVPGEGEIPNFTIWAPNPYKGRDTYLNAVELRPTNLAVTHHIGLRAAPLPAGTKLGRGKTWKDGPVTDFVPVFPDGTSFNEVSGGDINEVLEAGGDDAEAIRKKRSQVQLEAFNGQSNGNLLLFYVPGGGFYNFPDGAVKVIHDNDYLAWGMHYTPTGKPEKDRTRFGMWFAKNQPKYEIMTSRIGQTHVVEGEEVQSASKIPNIPPFADDWKITAITAFQDDITIYGMWPHMHLRGKDTTVIATYPDGREQIILHTPKWDFNWQLQYQFKEPVHLPAGSTLKAVGHFDNTVSNKWNPAPDKPVYWSEQSWDEMFNTWMEYSVDKNVIPVQKQTTQQH